MTPSARKKAWQLFFAFAFALFVATGFYYAEKVAGVDIALSTIAALLILSFVILYKILNSVAAKTTPGSLSEDGSGLPTPQFLHNSTVSKIAVEHPVLSYTIALAVLWLPYLVIFFPGIFMYDSTWELFQSQGSGALAMGRDNPIETGATFTDHKPIAHTLLIGFLFDLGKFLGSQTLGIFLITLSQYIFLAFSFACLLNFCKETGKRAIQRFSFFFFGLFPAFPMYAVSPFNDCVAVACFIPWAICFAKATSDKEWIGCTKNILTMMAWGTLSALMKKPNVYIIVFSILLLAFLNRKHVAKILFQAAAPALVVLVMLPSLLYPMLNVAQGDKGEMLGTALQQTVTYVREHGEKASSNDLSAINKIIDLDKALANYNPSTFDYAKYYYRNTETTTQLIDYLKLWVKQGLDDPICYISSFWMIQYPWIYPSTTIDFYPINYDSMIESVSKANELYTSGKSAEVALGLNYKAPMLLEKPREMLSDLLHSLEQMPITAPFFSMALYATWIPLFLTFIALTRKGSGILKIRSAIPVYISIAILFISPLPMFRYSLPVCALIPLLLVIAFPAVSRPKSKLTSDK